MTKVKFETLKVLVVEDHEPTRLTLVSILDAGGIGRTVAVPSAEAAVEQLKSTLFDLIICDLNLGAINGMALVKAIRQSAKLTNRYMAIIVLTADSRVETVTLAKKLGVNRFISKPVEPAGLLQAVRDTLERPRAFVETKEYFGPDRRVRDEPSMHERRKSDRTPKKPGFGDPWT